MAEKEELEMTTNDNDGGTALTDQILSAQTQYLKEIRDNLSKMRDDISSINSRIGILLLIVLISIVVSICAALDRFMSAYTSL